MTLDDKAEEYFQRTLRLAPIIRADAELLRSIRSVLKGEDKEDIILLGRGETHTIYSPSSRPIIDPLNQREIYLAIRVNRYNSLSWLIKEFVAMENAYTLGDNVPYFYGVVRWKRIEAVITEDISQRRRFTLEEINSEYVLKNGERVYLDPLILRDNKEEAQKYLQPKALVSIPRGWWER